MASTATHLRLIIKQALPILVAISDEEASVKPDPMKWSKKEIIGHLIDSACNNHQKFVRAMEQEVSVFPAYNQDAWVHLQQYNKMPWSQLLQLWQVYNVHIAQIMENLPQAKLHHKIYISEEGPFTLQHIVADYNEHLKHHLRSISTEVQFLANSIQMVY